MNDETAGETGDVQNFSNDGAALVQPLGADAFFRKNYDEAMALLIEARNYIAYQEAKDMAGLKPESRLLVSQETMRITCRLTQIMAWMLCQRGWREGEIEEEEALDEGNRLSGMTVCLDDRFQDDERLPYAVRSLLSRSHSLYIRVQRLENMVRGSAN